jgi:hypothetical protein
MWHLNCVLLLFMWHLTSDQLFWIVLLSLIKPKVTSTSSMPHLLDYIHNLLQSHKVCIILTYLHLKLILTWALERFLQVSFFFASPIISMLGFWFAARIISSIGPSSEFSTLSFISSDKTRVLLRISTH